jgi:hypothetical protein
MQLRRSSRGTPAGEICENIDFVELPPPRRLKRGDRIKARCQASRDRFRLLMTLLGTREVK